MIAISRILRMTPGLQALQMLSVNLDVGEQYG